MGERPSASVDLTVVIPAYNAQDHVVPAVASALTQEGVEVRVVVVDDGSTDDTARRVLDVADPRLSLLQQQNAGQGAARNRGAASASSPYLGFLDADDVLEPGWATAVVERLGAGADVVVTDAYVFGEAGRQDATYYDDLPFPAVDEQVTAILKRNFLISTAAVRASAFASAGGYPGDQRLRGVEDWALWQRILLDGGRAQLVPSVLSGYRRGHASTSSHVERMKAAELHLLRTLSEALPAGTAEGDAVRAGLQWTRGDLARYRMLVEARRRPRLAAVHALRAGWHWRSTSHLKTAVLLAALPARGRSHIDCL